MAPGEAQDKGGGAGLWMALSAMGLGIGLLVVAVVVAAGGVVGFYLWSNKAPDVPLPTPPVAVDVAQVPDLEVLELAEEEPAPPRISPRSPGRAHTHTPIEPDEPVASLQPLQPSTASQPLQPSTASQPLQPSTASRPLQPSTQRQAGSMVRPSSRSLSSSAPASRAVVYSKEPEGPATSPGSSLVRPGSARVDQAPAIVAAVAPEDVSCDDLSAMEFTASSGKLSAGQWACLGARRADTSARITDRIKVARVMLADAQTRCVILKQSCSDYHQGLDYFLQELDRSDADILYAWLLVRYRQPLQTEEACDNLIWWTEHTLAVRHQWAAGEVFVERTSQVYGIRSSAAYTRFQIANKTYLSTRTPASLEHEDQMRGEARDYVLEWLQFNRRAELDPTVPWEMCMTLAKKSGVCGDEG